ncbi:Ribosomal protein S19/S15 [Dillenia turbinata]|uniref:Ribosomal protein S19/S15 n=1 Tax=Dillenia turbinata TaxID=194707 RepID=A0AAN8VPH3_9MAGN
MQRMEENGRCFKVLGWWVIRALLVSKSATAVGFPCSLVDFGICGSQILVGSPMVRLEVLILFWIAILLELVCNLGTPILQFFGGFWDLWFSTSCRFPSGAEDLARMQYEIAPYLGEWKAVGFLCLVQDSYSLLSLVSKVDEGLPLGSAKTVFRRVILTLDEIAPYLGEWKAGFWVGQGRRRKKICKIHLCNMIIVPEMIGSIISVKAFNQVEIKPEIFGHYLAEFSISGKPVKHGRRIRATHSSRFIPLK